MAESTTTRFGLKRWTADSDTPDRTDFDGAHLEIATNVAGWLPDDTLANRPAAAPGNARFLFRATDTGLIYFSTGSAWSELSGTQIDVQTTAPSSPSTNDLWLDSDDESITVTTNHNDLTGLNTGNPHTQYLQANGTTALTQSLDETINEIASSTADASIDWHDGPIQEIVLDNSPTLTFANLPTSGGSLVLIVKQDGTGSRTVTWPTSVDWPAGTAPTLSTAASAVDIITFVCDNTGTTVVYGFASGLGMA